MEAALATVLCLVCLIQVSVGQRFVVRNQESRFDPRWRRPAPSSSQPMTTSMFGYNTTVNSTWTVDLRNQSRRADEESFAKEMKARFIPIILVAIPANLGIIAIILSNKRLRTHAFFLGILSISVFELCHGVFVLPMGLEHMVRWSEWRHGDNVCVAFQVIQISRTLLSSLMTVVMCAERLLVKLQSVSAISEKMVSTVSRVLIALPWCIGSLVCAPVIVLSRRDLSHHFEHDNYCVFVLEKDSAVPIFVTMFLLPICLLMLVPIATVIVYKYKKLHFTRVFAGAVEPEVVRLHLSTVSVWIVGFVYFALFVPMVTVITLLVMCLHDIIKCPKSATYFNVYTISMLPSAVTPFLWIITVEIRAILASLKASIIGLFAPTDGRKSVFSFSSLRNKTSSDDTVILS